LVEHNLDDLAAAIDDEKATDMKDIAHHAHDPVAASLDHDIVGQGPQQHHHLLRFKTFFTAFGHAQALMIAFEQRFHSPTALIIQGDVSQQDRSRIGVRTWVTWVRASTSLGARVEISRPISR